MTTIFRSVITLAVLTCLGVSIPALARSSDSDSDSDSDSHGAQHIHSSDTGPYGFKFSLRTDDGSPHEIVEDEDGSTHLKVVIGKPYRLVGKAPPKWSADRPFTYLVLESQVDGSEDAWIASRKIALNGKRRFDHTFTFPSTVGRRVWRMRVFNDDGEGTGAAPPTVVSGLLSTESDYAFTVNLINATKSDLVIYYPVQQIADGSYCEKSFLLNQGATATTTYTNPTFGSESTPPITYPQDSEAQFTYWAERQNSGAITDKYAMRWNYTQKGYNACSSDQANLKLVSGETYYIRLTPRSFASGFDAYVWSEGSLNIPVCSSAMLTNLGDDITDNSAEFAIKFLMFLGKTVKTVKAGLTCASTGDPDACYKADKGVVTLVGQAEEVDEKFQADLPSECPS